MDAFQANILHVFGGRIMDEQEVLTNYDSCRNLTNQTSDSEAGGGSYLWYAIAGSAAMIGVGDPGARSKDQDDIKRIQ